MIELKHDGPLWLALGRDRLDKAWKTQEWTWSGLAEKLSEAIVTRETLKEYLAMDKEHQALVKDVGGFVGGTMTGGRRVKGSVARRSLVTLDLEQGQIPLDLWFDLTMKLDEAMALYSTHKHGPGAPRFRLVVPLKREVHTDEFQAISRKLAETIGMDYLDHTSFQPERLMYWPSCPKDGQFVFELQDGPWLDPDEWLGRYRDWKDQSQWPRHELEKKQVHEALGKQEDPLLKGGVIGAFCRVYPISLAVDTYLDGAYKAVDGGEGGRYTYVHGSTAGGVTTYEDKFSYSFHATDPASLILCNAFDLVRLHRFKDLDLEVAGTTRSDRLPSFQAMSQLAVQDAQVRQKIGEEKLAEAFEAFNDGGEGTSGLPGAALEAVQGMDNKWLRTLDIDTRGNYRNTIDNICIVLRNDPNLMGALAKNEFSVRTVVRKRLPWHREYRTDQSLRNADLAGLRWYLEAVYKLTATGKIQDAVDIIEEEQAFHPVRLYLGGLAWDGVPRVARMLIRYLGAEDNEYVGQVTTKAMVAAVARVMRPGCKHDHMVVLVGPQGCGKSTMVSSIGMAWFSDSFGKIGTNAAMEQIQGIWVMELAELAGLRRSEVEEVKHFVAKPFDEFRPAYGKVTERFYRQNVFWGTTNDEGFLQDPTGGRRFWPVTCLVNKPEALVWEITQMDLDQLWAEARWLYEHGEGLILDKEMEAQARAVQADHLDRDDREEPIKRYLDRLLPGDWETMDIYERREFLKGGSDRVGEVERVAVTVGEIWCECLDGYVKEMNRFNTKPLHAIMKNMEGWALAGRFRKDKKNHIIYVKMDKKVTRHMENDDEDL